MDKRLVGRPTIGSNLPGNISSPGTLQHAGDREFLWLKNFSGVNLRFDTMYPGAQAKLGSGIRNIDAAAAKALTFDLDHPVFIPSKVEKLLSSCYDY